MVLTRSALRRPLAAVLITGTLLTQTGCSLLFTTPPPQNYQELNSFTCTESEAAPILDVVSAGLNLMSAVLIAQDKEAYEDADRAIAVSLVWTAVTAGSATYGFNNAKKCREARELAGNRTPQVLPGAIPSVATADPALVEITPAVDTLQVGTRTQLQASSRESSGALLPGRSYTWSSSNDAIASVNAAGTVYANAAGSVVIAARTGSVVGTATIVVVAP